MNIRIIWKVNKEIQNVKHVERNKYAAEKTAVTAQTMTFSVKDFLCKCDQIRRKLWIWSLLLKKSFLVFCAVGYSSSSYIIKFCSYDFYRGLTLQSSISSNYCNLFQSF